MDTISYNNEPNYGFTDADADKLLELVNDYLEGEFGNDRVSDIRDCVDEDGNINLAYTEYEDGDFYAVQTSYNIIRRCYVYTFYLNDGGEDSVYEYVDVEDFMQDLSTCDFDDFIKPAVWYNVI